MYKSKDLERNSSAVTLSDMEIFIFPELIYSLVLANLMSPRIWRWREDPWFEGFTKWSPYRRILRLRQYIMDHYAFNLDLETWGLTTKEQELARFREFMDENTLAQSNALFGYEGDKYYFDIDIRTHFGLNNYHSNVIPYWKTETVEAMDAFSFKPNYKTGAGECVSLSALYAAALFIVAGIPLRDIYLIATPLHSQNFIDINEGILTNNRRLVTKNMWFNGTALSAQARRALEREYISLVAHESGFIHKMYEDATFDPHAYSHFKERLHDFLKTRLTEETLGSFLRHSREFHKCFQIRWAIHGVDHYIGAEKVFDYEQGSPYRLSATTRNKLMAEIDNEEFQPNRLPERIVLNELEEYLRENNISACTEENVSRLKQLFASSCLNAQVAIENLMRFCNIEPRLPDENAKRFNCTQEPLGIEPGMNREQIIKRLKSVRNLNITADLSFYAYRDLSLTEAEPFLLAALERNPVSIGQTHHMDIASIFQKIQDIPNESIYDGPGRLAQPDEVWNFGRGDGLEKALLLANILRSRIPEKESEILIEDERALLKSGTDTYAFETQKGITRGIWKLSTMFL